MDAQSFSARLKMIHSLVFELGTLGERVALRVGFSRAYLKLRDEYRSEMNAYLRIVAKDERYQWVPSCVHAVSVLEGVDDENGVENRFDGLKCCSSAGALVALYEAEPDEDRKDDYLKAAEHWQVLYPTCGYREAFSAWCDQMVTESDGAIVTRIVETVTQAARESRSECFLKFASQKVKVILPVPTWEIQALLLTADQLLEYSRTRRSKNQRTMLLKYVYNGDL